MAWGKAGSTTLATAGDDITVTAGTTSVWNTFMYHGFFTGSGTVQHNTRFDGLATSIYSSRFFEDNLGDVTQAGTTGMNISPTAPSVAEDVFHVGYVCSFAGNDKLYIGNTIFNSTTGNWMPSRSQIVAKSIDTTALDKVSVVNTTAGSDFAVGANVSVLGSDITPQAGLPVNVQDNSILVEKDTGRRYWSSLGTQPDTITKDTQAIIQHGSTGTGAPDTFSSFTVANNSNRILILACGTYNSSPDITSVTWNSTETFTKIASKRTVASYNCELWYLINPTATTANCVIGSTGMGQMGACLYSFYNVDQSSPIGTPVTKAYETNTTSPFIDITPVNSGSMIIDSWYNGHGSTVTNNETDGMAIICGGVDRNSASQYDLTVTKDVQKSMGRTSGSDKYCQVAVEVNANSVLPKVIDGSIFYATDTNKAYVLYSGSWTEL